MKRILTGLLQALALALLRGYRRVSLDLLKIQAAVWYVRGVQTARSAFLAVLMLALCIAVGVVGFVLFHVGLFLLIPWPWNAGALMALGAIYVIAALFVVRWLCSEKTWMKFSNADKYVKSTTKKPD